MAGHKEPLLGAAGSAGAAASGTVSLIGGKGSFLYLAFVLACAIIIFGTQHRALPSADSRHDFIDASYRAHQMPKVAVPRYHVKALTRSQKSQIQARTGPVIVTGAFEDSHPFPWTFETLQGSPPGDVEFFVEEANASIALAELARQASEVPPGPCLRDGNLDTMLLKKLEIPFPNPEVFGVGKGQFEKVGLWLGGMETRTRLHADTGQDGTIACHFLGRKRWFLYPPQAARFLYQKEPELAFGGQSVQWSGIEDPRAVDPKAFPEFQSADRHRIEVVVSEGEALIVPKGYFHFVVNEAPSLMVSFRVQSKKKKAGAADS